MLTSDHYHAEILVVFIFGPKGFLNFCQFTLARTAPSGKDINEYYFPFQVSVAGRSKGESRHLVACFDYIPFVVLCKRQQ